MNTSTKDCHPSTSFDGLARTEKKKLKICVIGAGPSGLAAVKQLADYENEFEILALEQKSDVGGLWIYTDNIEDEHGESVQSSMYKNLRTHRPKEVMGYPDYPELFGEDRSSVTHTTVLKYLRNFTDHFNLRRHIQFNSRAEKVIPILGNGDWRTTQWKVLIRNLNNNSIQETICNAVMICNGYDSKPRIPEILKIETFPGKVIHSHIYRRPEVFADKTVAILGAGVSGIDIGVEISPYAKKIYLSHNKKIITSILPSNMVQVAGIVSADGQEFTLKDGSKITADDLILCTGYLRYYPFLDEKSKITVNKKRVQPLYKYFINMEHPSMFIPGIPYPAVGFSIFYTQALYFVTLLRGKMQLPDRDKMETDVMRLNEHHANFPNEAIWDYYNELMKEVGGEIVPPFYRTAFQTWEEYRLIDMYHFKDNNLYISDSNEVILIPPKTATDNVSRKPKRNSDE